MEPAPTRPEFRVVSHLFPSHRAHRGAGRGAPGGPPRPRGCVPRSRLAAGGRGGTNRRPGTHAGPLRDVNPPSRPSVGSIRGRSTAGRQSKEHRTAGRQAQLPQHRAPSPCPGPVLPGILPPPRPTRVPQVGGRIQRVDKAIQVSHNRPRRLPRGDGIPAEKNDKSTR